MIAFGSILIYIALKLQSRTQKLRKIGIQTEGIIFDTVPSDNPDSRAVYPLIRFVTSEKLWITEKYSISTIPGVNKKGDKVTVVYDPNNPKDFFIKSPLTSLMPKLIIILAFGISAAGFFKLLHVQL